MGLFQTNVIFLVSTLFHIIDFQLTLSCLVTYFVINYIIVQPQTFCFDFQIQLLVQKI